MHRTDGDSHVSNLFDEGDPGVPRAPTQVDAPWLNAVQEELVNTILDLGVALVKGTNNQLSAALRAFFVDMSTTQSAIAGVKTWVARQIINLNSTSPALTVGNNNTLGPGIAVTTTNGLPLSLSAVNGKSQIYLRPSTSLPSTNAAGTALGAGDEGLICYVSTGHNKLYVWDGSAWNPCWP